MFYRNLFGFLCLCCFILGLWTKSPYAYWGALVSGTLSRAAVRKGWNPPKWLTSLFRWSE
jgi:hypothetical protein